MFSVYQPQSSDNEFKIKPPSDTSNCLSTRCGYLPRTKSIHGDAIWPQSSAPQPAAVATSPHPAQTPSSPLLQPHVTCLHPQGPSQPSLFAGEVMVPVSSQFVMPQHCRALLSNLCPFLHPWEKLHKISIKPPRDSPASSSSATPTILDEV